MKNKDEWLIFVTAGKWQSNCIKKAKAIGLKVLTIDSDKNTDGFQLSDHKIVSNLDNSELLIDKIKSLKLIELQEDVWAYCLNTLKWSTKEIFCDKKYLKEDTILSKDKIDDLLKLNKLFKG